MTRVNLLAALLLLAFGSQAGVTPAGPRPGGATAPTTGTAMITGRILSESDAPIAAATVSIANAAAGPRAESTRVLTDAEGRYFFSNLAAGSVSVTVTKPGWLPGAFGRERPGGASVPVTLTEGQRQNDVNIRLWRTAVISGRVVDQTGEAMVAVDVRAFRLSYPAGRALPVFATRAFTDDRGVYRFASLDPGDYLICVPATVTSEPSGFAGVIRAQNGTPPAYLQTMTAVGTAPTIESDRATGVTNSERWNISSLVEMPGTPPANGAWLTYPTTFAPSSLTRATAAVVRAESGRERGSVDITLRLTPTFQVSGTLVGPDGPATYHSVHLLPADSVDAPVMDTGIAVTDGAGAFTFFGIAPGNYVARVVRTPLPQGYRTGIFGGTGAIANVGITTSGPGPGGGPPIAPIPSEPLLHVSQPLAVGDRDVRDLVLQLRPGVRVSGRVQFDGTPPPGDAIARMQLALEPAAGQTYANVFPGLATATGEFSTPSTWPGRYLIRAIGAPAGWRLQSATVRGVDASETAVDLSGDVDDAILIFSEKSSTITGTVQFDGTPAKPVAAAVLLFPADPKQWIDYGRTSRIVRSVAVALGGAYSLPAPPEGDYFLVAIPDAMAADWSNPTTLQRLAAIAEKIQIRGTQPVTRALPLRRLR